MIYTPAEIVSKNKVHYQQRKQRGQNAPEHPQHGPLVFLFKIPLYQLFKQELVFFLLMDKGIQCDFLQLSFKNNTGRTAKLLNTRLSEG